MTKIFFWQKIFACAVYNVGYSIYDVIYSQHLYKYMQAINHLLKILNTINI